VAPVSRQRQPGELGSCAGLVVRGHQRRDRAPTIACIFSAQPRTGERTARETISRRLSESLVERPSRSRDLRPHEHRLAESRRRRRWVAQVIGDDRREVRVRRSAQGSSAATEEIRNVGEPRRAVSHRASTLADLTEPSEARSPCSGESSAAGEQHRRRRAVDDVGWTGSTKSQVALLDSNFA